MKSPKEETRLTRTINRVTGEQSKDQRDEYIKKHPRSYAARIAEANAKWRAEQDKK